ncbi:MAG: anti-sigma F factor [Clostridia bacterium]|nr:anti-sigma F factor [Clostridia bacterium]
MNGKIKPLNTMKLVIESRSVNESFARNTVAAFAGQLDPTVGEISDIKTAVSEAVTNCIVHAYPDKVGLIYITAKTDESGTFTVCVKDCGTGIKDIKLAMTPLYTTQQGERAGLGFAVMESFMDRVKVHSVYGNGTKITMSKYISGK